MNPETAQDAESGAEPTSVGGRLRRRLADQLERDGELRSDRWRRAVEQVPREVFLGECVYRRRDTATGTLWEPLTRARLGESAWLELAYENTTWVTQFDARDQPPDQVPDGPVQGAPTSSSTLPGLVVGMLEDLDVHDGHTVLEIGTGTGYSTGLLCQRLGANYVTSIEVDETVAGRAAAALAVAGYAPTLITGDGLVGHQPTAPYDRIIAACSVRTIPPAWINQSAPGGRILTTTSGWLYGSGLLALHTSGDGTAHGRYLPKTASFMPARAHAAPPLPTNLPARHGDTRTTDYGPDLLENWMGRFLAQLAAPTAQRAHLPGTDGTPPADLLLDQSTGSYAWLTPTDHGTTVQQHGPVRLWDQIEHTHRLWDHPGRPDQSAFTVHATSRGQFVQLDTPKGPHSWPMPTG